MRKPDFIRYWYVEKRELGRSLRRFILHVVCPAGIILIPLFFPGNFKLKKPYEYFLFGHQSNSIQVNWPAVSFVLILLIGERAMAAGRRNRKTKKDYVLEPIRRNPGPMLKELSRVHLSSGSLCTTTLVIASKIIANDDKDKQQKAKKLLKDSMQKLLDSIDRVVQSYMDTVRETDRITSNLMVALDPKKFDGRSWSSIEKMLDSKRLYSKDGCDSKNCIAWVSLVIQSHKSLETFELDSITFRVHKQPTLAIPGAGNAYHHGLFYIENKNLDLRFSAINDVTRIQWPSSMPEVQSEAINHFKQLGEIKSFISVPLVQLAEVVGVLNVNYSGFYLAGRSEHQRSILESLLFPIVPCLANMLEFWRKIEYDI